MDALVVLGCRVHPDGRLTDAASRRVNAAAAAYLRSRPRKVIASGGRVWNGRTEAEVFSRALVSLGVPEDVLVREVCSLSTVGNAWYSARILREGGLESVVVVTCEWHMPRALACFARVGVHAVPAPAEGPPVSPWRRLSRAALERSRAVLDRHAARAWAKP